MKPMLLGIPAFLFLLLFPLVAQDLDRDTIPDAEEQSLLERFAPRFLIAPNDCDAAPSAFLSVKSDPVAGAEDGTLYGQVFRNGHNIEIHFYHLWANDCGRGRHPLDVEHVSALIDPLTNQAKYWYASAHDGTLCDAGHGAPAASVDGLTNGPLVWVSRNKHASFLDQGLCGRGCGGDECTLSKRWRVARIVNVGEREAPLNGATWILSPRWRFASKMNSDFPASVQSAIAAASGVTHVNAVTHPVRATIGAGNTSLDAVGAADRHTRSALSTANRRTRGFLRRPPKP